MKIERLPELDMVTEESRTFYGVEWIDRFGQAICRVYPRDVLRDTYARGCVAAGAINVATFEISAPGGTDIDAAYDFARGNMRLQPIRPAAPRAMSYAVPR
jgi:hypothetical protein